MSREQNYTAIILKKQPLNESDEIVTFYTQENGKVRALAKSIKSSKSKLQQRLQALFLVKVILAGGKFPKIISVETQEVFAGLRENLSAMKMAFYAVEVLLKSTADEEKNELLFDLVVSLLNFLNSNSDENILDLGLGKFKVEVLDSLGLAIQQPKILPEQKLYFSPIRAGFFPDRTADAVSLDQDAIKLFAELKTLSFGQLKNLPIDNCLPQLQELLSNFISYQLERKIKSETYLKM